MKSKNTKYQAHDLVVTLPILILALVIGVAGCSIKSATQKASESMYIALSAKTEEVKEIVFERRNITTNGYDRTTIRPGEAHMKCESERVNKEITIEISEGKSAEMIEKAFSIEWPKNPQIRRHARTRVGLILRTSEGEERVVFDQRPSGAMQELYKDLMMIRERCFEKAD